MVLVPVIFVFSAVLEAGMRKLTEGPLLIVLIRNSELFNNAVIINFDVMFLLSIDTNNC